MPDWEEHARQLRAERWTYQRIGDEIGVTAERVRKVLGEPPNPKLQASARRNALRRWYGDRANSLPID